MKYILTIFIFLFIINVTFADVNTDTVQIRNGLEDTYINESSNNYSTEDSLILDDKLFAHRKVFVMFANFGDSIPSNANIIEANLYLYFYSVSGTGTVSLRKNCRERSNISQLTYQQWRTGSDWTTNGGNNGGDCATGSNDVSGSGPDYNNTWGTSNSSITSSNAWHSISIDTSYMNQKKGTNDTVQFKLSTSSTFVGLIRSSEYTGTTYDPYLQIIYTTPIPDTAKYQVNTLHSKKGFGNMLHSKGSITNILHTGNK